MFNLGSLTNNLIPMKILLIILAVVCLGASIAMYIIGNDSSHLSELKDFWYVPLPLALFAAIGAFRKTPNADN